MDAPSAEKRLARKRSFPLYIYPTAGVLASVTMISPSHRQFVILLSVFTSFLDLSIGVSVIYGIVNSISFFLLLSPDKVVLIFFFSFIAFDIMLTDFTTLFM